MPTGSNVAEPRSSGARFFWRDERATLPYDLWVIAILAFIWLTPPDWLRDPDGVRTRHLGMAPVSAVRR